MAPIIPALISAGMAYYTTQQGKKIAQGTPQERDARNRLMEANLANLPQATEATGQGLTGLQDSLKLWSGLAQGPAGSGWEQYGAPRIEALGTANRQALGNAAEFSPRGGGTSAMLNNPLMLATGQAQLQNELINNAQQQQQAAAGQLVQAGQGVTSGGTQGGLGVGNQSMQQNEMGYNWGANAGGGLMGMMAQMFGGNNKQGGYDWSWLKNLFGGQQNTGMDTSLGAAGLGTGGTWNPAVEKSQASNPMTNPTLSWQSGYLGGPTSLYGQSGAYTRPVRPFGT